jgi:hypothetical protein
MNAVADLEAACSRTREDEGVIPAVCVLSGCLAVSCCAVPPLQELPDVRSLNVQTQQLQVELQDLERKLKFKAAEATTTKEHIEAAKVCGSYASVACR